MEWDNPWATGTSGTLGSNTGGGLADYFSSNNLGSTLSGLGSLFTGGMQAYTGFQNIGLANKALSFAKKQFNFQKALANRNLANQAKTINNAYDASAQVAAGMIGGQDAAGNYGFTSQDIIDKYAAIAKEKHVEGSAL